MDRQLFYLVLCTLVGMNLAALIETVICGQTPQWFIGVAVATMVAIIARVKHLSK